MSLRLSTGFCHGMQLENPAASTRPTAGRVRAAVWNSLQQDLAGARVLDLFAGSGAVGIEALSRGARHASFVENDRDALRSLQQNLKAVRERAQKQNILIEAQVYNQDALAALAACQPRSFDILWLDPPYALLGDLLPRLGEALARVAHEGSRLVIESHLDSLPLLAQTGASWARAWELSRQKVYGKIGVSFFTRRPEEE